ncbi:MAG: diaminopimelate decarboxylase [Planctomycetota bacterium]
MLTSSPAAAALPYTPAEIAAAFGTPTWVYDAAVIERRIAEVELFDTVRYAQKANSNLAVLALMRKHGVKVDAVTAGEIHRAQLAGYTLGSDDVVYTADLFDDDALERIARYRIPVNVGSPDMIDQLHDAGIDVPITLRINPGFGHGHSQKVNTGGESSKHGIWHTQIPQCLAAARSHRLTVRGLHMHIGSGTDFHHLAQVCEAMTDAARTFAQHADSLTTVSAGGGLPIPYRKDQADRIDLERYYRLWDETRNTIAQIAGRPIHLEVEPGRYLVAESGSLLTRVRSVKESGSKRYLIIDAGFNDLVRPSFYGAYHHISIHPDSARADQTAATSPAESASDEAEDVDYIVAGPLCESCDVFTQEEDGTVTTRRLPRAAAGDLLVLHDAGAYGMAMSSNYNSRRLAAEVMLFDGKPHVVRERQTLESLTQFESIPDIV